jgi:hypothetical protein
MPGNSPQPLFRMNYFAFVIGSHMLPRSSLLREAELGHCNS